MPRLLGDFCNNIQCTRFGNRGPLTDRFDNKRKSMTTERTLLSCVMLLVFCTTSLADETRNFFVAPITTELHRTTVSSSADAYAIVNCNPLIVEGDLDLTVLDEDEFLLALQAATATPNHLILVCRYQFPADLDTPLRTRLNKRLKELCASAGFQKVSLSETRTSADWKDAYHRADDFDQPEDALEPLVENAHVRVFPVRTRLSKLVHGEADCIVEVIHPIDGRMSEIPFDLKSAIRQAVQATDLTEKQSLIFKLSSTAAGREKVEVLFDFRAAPKIPETESIELRRIFEANAGKYKPSPALQLAQELGFQEILYTHSPGGGAPETLVGAKAPNFKLTRLNGARLRCRPTSIDYVLGTRVRSLPTGGSSFVSTAREIRAGILDHCSQWVQRRTRRGCQICQGRESNSPNRTAGQVNFGRPLSRGCVSDDLLGRSQRNGYRL